MVINNLDADNSERQFDDITSDLELRVNALSMYTNAAKLVLRDHTDPRTALTVFSDVLAKVGERARQISYAALEERAQIQEALNGRR